VNHWMRRLELALGAAAVRSHRRPWVSIVVGLSLLVAGSFFARSLTLNANLVDLLPESFQSVQDIRQLRERFGGIGFVAVVGQGADEKTLKRFADDLAPVLEQLPGIRSVEHRRPTEFFEKRALYFLDVKDLETIEERVDDRLSFERDKRNPLSLGLEEQEEAPPLDFSDIEKKYASSADRRLKGNGETYYYSKDEGLIAMLAKPEGNSADLGYAKKIVAEVEEAIGKQDLSKYGPNFHWAVTGTYKKKVDQQIEITSDLARASLIALGILVAYVLLHFRSFVAVGLCLFPVAAGLSWTYGFTAIAYGQVNLLTGFLGAILGGLGTEHGIHLIGRYGALRDEGLRSEDAVRDTFRHTGVSALIAALVAALVFSALAISKFRAFREFGVIGAIGMILAVLAYVLLLPPLLGLADRWGWRPTRRPAAAGHNLFTRWIARLRGPIAIAALLVFVPLAVKASEVRFNYDFSALDDVALPSVQLDKRVNRVLGYSQTPVVVLTDTAEAAARAKAQLELRKRQSGTHSTLDFVATIEDVIPQQQPEKQAVLQRIHQNLKQIDPQKVQGPERRDLERGLELTSAAPFGIQDAPPSLRSRFETSKGEVGRFVVVYTRINMADAEQLRELSKEVRNLHLGGGTHISAAGEAMILVDILDMVEHEIPIVLGVSLGFALLATWLTMGSLLTALLCLLPTAFSVFGLMGVMAITDLRFNSLNIVVVPVLIGTTIDAGVHLMSWFGLSETEFAKAYRETGRAIIGGLVTSAVGFGAMIMARHPGLNSIGTLANLGFGINLVITLVAFPALLFWLARRRAKSEPEVEADPASP
jgi:predicted RND superfamily exporter protein